MKSPVKRVASTVPKAKSQGRSDEHEIRPAEVLRKRLNAPIHNRMIGRDVGRGELDYEIYLKTLQLLSLQSSNDELVIPDELMFQVVHQSQELYMKLVASNCVDLVQQLDDDCLAEAGRNLKRMLQVMCCLRQEMKILDGLTPAAFLTIRRHLGDGSGQQSPGFNQLMLASEAINSALDRLLYRRDLTLEDIYEEGSMYVRELRLCEQLVDLDQSYQEWLMAHFLLVRRTIGVDRRVRALDGFPTEALTTRMLQPLFPGLWEVRVTLSAGWQRAGGYAPGESRSSEPPFAPDSTPAPQSEAG